MVRVHPNFRLVALGNTKGEGEDELHNARAQIDEAVRQRMTPKYFDYDNRLEENIFNQENIAWLAFIRKFRGACLAWAKKEDHTFAPGNVTTRDASAISRYAKNNSKTLEEVLAEKFIQTKDNQYLGFLMKNIADSYKLREVTKFNYPKNISKVSENEIAKAFVLEIKKRVNL